MALDAALVADLQSLVGARHVVTAAPTLRNLCKDYSWFSPLVEAEVATWQVADVAVAPQTVEQVVGVVELATRHAIPITVRGAGTGNYGQAVPRDGGILVLTSGLHRVLEWGPDRVSVEAGVRLGDLERTARDHGLELRIYPSTYLTSTAGGFVAGGAGGIGSVTWGTLRDGNVLAATLVTTHERPELRHVEGADVLSVVHAFGTTGLLTSVTLALAPAVAWEQCAVAFPRFDAAFAFGRQVCEATDVPKRLVSIHEWPIPRMFTTLERAGGVLPEHAIALLELGEGTTDVAARMALEHGGALTWRSPHADYHAAGRIAVSDFSFNHTMLWARRADSLFTYLQVGFGELAQLEALKRAYPDLLLHVEFMRVGDRLGVVSLPLLRFSTAERLYEVMAFCEGLGARVIDPHTWLLTVDPASGSPIASAKAANDPHNLMNPGKVRTPEGVQ